MAGLPSYHDAVTRLDWLGLVAPYVSIRDYARCCVVSRRFYDAFSPRLWREPLRVVRQLGLDPADDLDWYFDFVFKRLPYARTSTLRLVHALDFRNFAKHAYNFGTDAGAQRSIPETFRQLLARLPNLRCILLDGHSEIDPGAVTAAGPEGGADQRKQQLVMLSFPFCDARLSPTFFDSPHLRNLVFLDVSGLPGSLKPLMSSVEAGRKLLCLRVLKAKRREIDDAVAAALFKTFQSRLWSLDLSDNNLTDDALEPLRTFCFDSPSLRNETRFLAEGKLWKRPELLGSDEYGEFRFIYESEWSGSFSHAERYYVDAPQYVQDAARAGPQEYQAIRSDARGPLTHDTAEYVKTQFTGGTHSSSPGSAMLLDLDVSTAPTGLTHLHLSGNSISCGGLQRLLWLSSGQLEHLDCDAPVYQPLDTASPTSGSSLPRSTRIYGMLGSAHVFRPVISSNLRSLRMHHSIVTQIPTLEVEGLSTLARWHIAETDVRERADVAFPQVFVPDMNPRLASLTLSKIPRRSAGPLIERLTQFLKLASLQEKGIRDAAALPLAPACVRGLRHIRLEFESDPMEDPTGFSTADDLAAEQLLDMGGQGFSFFTSERDTQSLRTASRPASVSSSTLSPLVIPDGEDSLSGSFRANGSRNSPLLDDRIQKYPYTSTTTEFLAHPCTWLDAPSTVHVWIGGGVPGIMPAVNRYMDNVCSASLRSRVGPVMPVHVAAGAPEGVLIFHAAWEAEVLPRALVVPTEHELRRMRDVLEEIKTWRRRGRAVVEAQRRVGGDLLGEPACYWTGSLEVELQVPGEHYQKSDYWR